MSHSFSFMRFVGGEQIGVPEEEIVEILRDHGFETTGLTEGANELPPPLGPSGGPEVGHLVSAYVSDGCITEVGIERPSYLDPFRSLAYDLMSRAALVMFSSDGGSLYACNVQATDLPEGMIEQFGEMHLSVASIADLS